MVGQDAAVTRPDHRAARARARAARGRARRREDAAGALAVRVARRWRPRRVQFTPDLMPGDVTGLDRVRREHRQVRLPRRPGLHEPAARRRDQPHAAEDAVGAARGDGGAAGHASTASRGRCRSRSSSPRRRTRSSTRAPTRCPRRSSTASCMKLVLDLPPREQEVEVLARHAAGFDPRDLAGAGHPAGAAAGGARGGARGGAAGAGDARTCSATSSTSSAAPGTRP